MITVDSVIQIITTPRKEYSEGPIFFKRKGIYYYLYTIGGDEKYQYAYVMSKTSPMGPFEYPEQDIISTTNYERGVFGPGHGCVFNPEGTDDYYLLIWNLDGVAQTGRHMLIGWNSMKTAQSVLSILLWKE